MIRVATEDDLPELTKNVPEEQKEKIVNMARKMMKHPAYGQV